MFLQNSNAHTRLTKLIYDNVKVGTRGREGNFESKNQELIPASKSALWDSLLSRSVIL